MKYHRTYTGKFRKKPSIREKLIPFFVFAEITGFTAGVHFGNEIRLAQSNVYAAQEVAGEAETTLSGQQPSPAPSPTPETEIVPGDNWDEFVAAVDKVAPIYNYPKNVVLAQAALESARGTSKYAVERNNYLGINAVDSNPDLAYTFENAEQCVIEYMRLVRKNFPEAWAHRDNPELLLRHLKHNKSRMMYATDPYYVKKVMSMKEWNQ